jgi:ankyrin repeat protein
MQQTLRTLQKPSDVMDVVMSNDVETLRKLLDQVPFVAQLRFNSDGDTLLHCAQSKEAVQLLVAAGASLETCTKSGATPLIMAIRHGKLAAVEQLLLSGASLTTCDHTGSLPLHSAIYQSDAIFDAVFKDVTVIDQYDISGVTPLHVAAHVGNLHAARRLVEAGAATVVHVHGQKPLEYAKQELKYSYGSEERKTRIRAVIAYLSSLSECVH